MVDESLDPRTAEEWEAVRRVGHDLVDRVIAMHRELRDGPCWQSMPEAVRAQLATPPTRAGIGIEAAMARAQELLLPYGSGNLHPRFWGWVIGAGTVQGMLGSWLAAAMNANVWGGDQGLVHLETQVLQWFRSWFEFPETASGILLDGASAGNALALAIARHAATEGRAKREGVSAPSLRVYCSDTIHNSLRKGAELLGLGANAIHSLPALADGRADVAAIERAILADREAGLLPFFVAASAGTVATGAIDPLLELRLLADRERLWFHVDAAIGAVAWLSASLRPALAGMERADSLAFDLHKWAQVPYDAGCLLVRDSELHRATFAVPADYLGALSGGATPRSAPVFHQLGPQLSRGDRALKIWLMFQALGVDRIAAVFERNVAQAQLLAAAVRRSPHLTLMAPVELNIVCMRVHTPEGMSPGAADAANERVLVALQESGRAILSPVRVGGRFCLRASICNHRTRDEDIELVVRELEALAQSIQ